MQKPAVYDQHTDVTASSPKLCIFHGHCQDGFGAAFAVRRRFQQAVEFHAGFFSEAPPEVLGRDVILVDFSYDRAVMQAMAARARSVLILDHHISAQAELQPLLDAGVIQGLFDLERSGAMLAWEYFNPGEPVPDLIRYIQDRDLGRFALPNSREIFAAISSYPLQFEVWDQLMETRIDDLIDEGRVILRKLQRDLEVVLPSLIRSMVIGNYVVPAANIPHMMTSEVGSRLAQGHPFGVTYYDTPTHRVFSLRSTKDGVDVSKVAELYGGGGHRHAAGFRVTHDVARRFEPLLCDLCHRPCNLPGQHGTHQCAPPLAAPCC